MEAETGSHALPGLLRSRQAVGRGAARVKLPRYFRHPDAEELEQEETRRNGRQASPEQARQRQPGKSADGCPLYGRLSHLGFPRNEALG